MAKTYEEFLQESLKELRFEDAFNIDELQELQDVLANSLQIASLITALDGTPITKPSNFCRLCKRYVRTTEQGLKQCMYSDSVIGSSKADGFTVSKCLSVGLLDAGVSIKIGDKHVANWMFGQVRDEYEDFTDAELRQKAEEIEAEVEGFVEAFKQVPIISRDRFEYIAQLVYMISKQLSEQAYQNCIQRVDENYRKLLAEEITHHRELAEYNNSIDDLTGLNNRNYYEKQIEKLDKLGITPIAVIVGDVNHLKVTNDVFGHRHGDWLLKTIAEVMLEEAFDGYIICRCGGDEFNVIIPNANRADAEWYCTRVRIELAKRFGCCVMPSVAFGVSKKSHKHERLKDIIDSADVKMYRDKMMIKEKQHMIANIQQVLLGRGYLTPEYQNASIGMARRFGEYLGEFDSWFVKRLTRVVRVQDYGYVILLRDDLFANRFKEEQTLEAKREIMKHPTISHKIAKLWKDYESVADEVLAHEENWDGTGYPNHLSGEAIPVMSRLSKIVGDYNIFVAKAPIGVEMTKKEACQKIEAGIGTKYDPVYGKRFLEFLEQDEESGPLE